MSEKVAAILQELYRRLEVIPSGHHAV